MKRLSIIAIIIVMLGVLMLALQSQGERRDEVFTVGIAPQEGFTIVGDNPVQVKKGENAVFHVQINENYVFSDASLGSLIGGVLTVENVQQGSTIYLTALKNCRIELVCDANGSALLTGGNRAVQGQTVTLELIPGENYVPGSVEVGSTVFPAPTGNSFTFTIEDDCIVNVHFVGRKLNFLTVSQNLGHVQIENIPEIYRYGDVVRLRSEFDAENVIFKGWSIGGYLSDGGELISSDVEFSYTLQQNTTLYANFSHKSAYSLRYDANGGTIRSELSEEHAPGAYVNLAINNGDFRREGYALIGFSTAPDGGNVMVPGAMMRMPTENTTLYAIWEKQADADTFTYEEQAGKITITGILDKTVTKLVIPTAIGGKAVSAIEDHALRGLSALETVVLPVGLEKIGAGCFAGCSALETVYFPETITSLSDSAFEGCTNFRNMRVIASLGRAFDYDYDSALVDKYMRLKHTQGKRLILVGGSNLAFGINSELIAERFPEYTVVNLGTSRHYGIMPLFDLLKANIHEGDIVIFCPEYYKEMYGAAQASTITNWQYLESNYDMLKDIDLQTNTSLLDTFTDYLATKRSYLPGKKVNPKPAYIRAGFNQYGDLTSQRSCGGIFDLALPDITILTDDGMARYNEVCKYLSDRGAVCCFSFPSRCAGAVERSQIESKTAAFAAALENKLDKNCCTVISNIADYYFSGYVFYDSDYHMTREGADIRTTQLIDDLARFLED